MSRGDIKVPNLKIPPGVGVSLGHEVTNQSHGFTCVIVGRWLKPVVEGCADRDCEYPSVMMSFAYLCDLLKKHGVDPVEAAQSRPDSTEEWELHDGA